MEGWDGPVGGHQRAPTFPPIEQYRRVLRLHSRLMREQFVLLP